MSSVYTPLKKAQLSLGDSSKSEREDDIVDSYENFRGAEGRNPHYPNQKDLKYLIRDLGLTKSNVKLLMSRLKQWKLLDEIVKVTIQKKCHHNFSSFFTYEGWVVRITSDRNEWRLFINISSRSHKAMPSHNGNIYPSLPLAHTVYLKEDFSSNKTLLDALKYDDLVPPDQSQGRKI
ncbi:hypothetical protein J437_LFUL001766 [Ladona fulva]|uniref:Uncharacterized protein n=1 Tax=Ladona fulva TaxID=123851 RepID=A0A8K0JWH1_LADFU|nr:hypothetical protein J437_LFUL001766 [Ladona fulva]